MPDRILRERITTSPELDSLSAEAERLFYRGMVRCDDYGNFEAAPEILLAQCFPRRAGSWNPRRVLKWRDELVRAGLWHLYSVNGRLYGAFVTWARHQRARASRPKFPKPDHPNAESVGLTGSRQSAASCGELPQIAARARDVRGRAVESRESRDESREACRKVVEPAPATPPLADAGREGEAEDRRVDVRALLGEVTAMLGAPAEDRARVRSAGRAP